MICKPPRCRKRGHHVGRIFLYQWRLVVQGLRRHPGRSLVIVVGLAMAGAMWTFGVARYLRHHGPYPALTPHLHQVELAHHETPAITRMHGNTHTTASWATHTRVTFPEYLALHGSGIPTRETGTYRARLLAANPLGRGETGLARLVRTRFVGAAFFPLFELPIGRGRGFSPAEEAAGAAVAVIGHRLNQRLFAGQDSVGRDLLIEGRQFRIVGIVDRDQPVRPTWDISSTDRDQDAVYLPFGWCRRLLARPETMVKQSAAGRTFDDLIRSDAVFVSFWAELPTPERRAAFRALLDERFARHGQAYVLRSFDEWKRVFTLPGTRIAFLTVLSGLLLLVAGFSVARLLLATTITRRGEFGVHRALGASRGVLFVGQMLEAAVLSLAAALFGVALTLPYMALFNRVVADMDIPVQMTVATFVLGAGGAFITGLGAALYPAWRVARTPPTLRLERH
jgi:putative ABC transport system permease protein